MIFLCGGTGQLGGRIAQLLHGRGLPFRALVRETTDPSSLDGTGADIVRGDLRDASTLERCLGGSDIIITTANAIGRILSGHRDLTIHDVDERGNANLIDAAERERVSRFVFVSAGGCDAAASTSPFARAKVLTEERLRASAVQAVIIRPDMFQELWLAPLGGFDWPRGKMTIFGKGEAKAAYAAVDDVAEAVVLLALGEDPPPLIELGGPERLTRKEAVEAFEEALGRPLRRRHVPRIVLRVGSRTMSRIKPAVASLMGQALMADLADTSWDDRSLRELGVNPRPASDFIREATQGRGTEAASDDRVS